MFVRMPNAREGERRVRAAGGPGVSEVPATRDDPGHTGGAPADGGGSGDGGPRRAGLSLDVLRSGGARALEVESGSVLVATLALAGVIGILHPEFFTWSQIKDVLAQSVYVGILAA